jgi:hypothetical protein
MSFVNENDIDEERWDAQEIKFVANYNVTIDDIDNRRLNCVSSLFNQVDRDKWKFRILKTDSTDRTGVTPVELKIIQSLY